MSENNRQVGGDHYKRPGRREHWDVVDDNNIGYLEGQATKYIARWRSAGGGGLKSLRKAEHYTAKLIEKVMMNGRRPRGCVSPDELASFIANYELTPHEAIVCGHLFQWYDVTHLQAAHRVLQDMIEAREYEDAQTQNGQ